MESLKLTERDVKILEYIAQHGSAQLSQIGKKFWENLNSKIHGRRIRVLEKLGLIEKLWGDQNALLGYRLTIKGINFLKTSKPHELYFHRASHRSSFAHDQILIEVENIFTQSPLVSHFIPEHQLRVLFTKKYGKEEKRDRGFKVPDAFFKLRSTKGILNVALELELSEKAEVRYHKILTQLSISEEFTAIFYVYKEEKVRLKIERILKYLRENSLLVRGWQKPHGFYFCSLAVLKRDLLNAKFSGEETMFSMTSLAQQLE